MSLILDALKKSEQTRPSVTGSAWSVATATPRSQRVPNWAWVLIGLLISNVAILMTVLSVDLPKEIEAPNLNAAHTEEPQNELPQDDIRQMSAREIEMDRLVGISSATSELPTRLNPSIPSGVARTPTDITPERIGQATLQATDTQIATRDQLIAQGFELPTVTLNLHVYDAQRNTRFVILNGERLQEGDRSASGLLISNILADGVVLTRGNTTFKVSLP
jgi:hypothetical protein